MTHPKTAKNKIIVAPLNWGWGHATRCIPLIREILNLGYQPVIACDGDALIFLKKEFSSEEFLELPSYGIKYKEFFLWSIILNIPKIIKAIFKEKSVIKNYVKQHKNETIGIISDNRLGVYCLGIPSVYMTHQLNIKAGFLSSIVNIIHHFFIKKHKECWVPDDSERSLSGDLSTQSIGLNVKYIGVLSRFTKRKVPIEYDLLILLSGIEGQRLALEEVMMNQLQGYQGKVLLVRGSLKPSTRNFPKQVKVVDYLLSDQLENALNASRQVVARSGYSTIMDMAILEKKAFYIPTVGQTEQEYLASYQKEKKRADYSTQKDFKITLVDSGHAVSPFPMNSNLMLKCLISIFKLSQA
ncbi:MAG: glycosyltransferase [Wenyingzhuangia sp.]|jgi:UDP:flavonoid glycosyltransferase YjiC (YdhE family)|uniref:glycosyltransferase n=1 Tax=Wenyingzhuangia sp. TaxID=1964193 RepID=UPI003219430D